VTGVPPLSAIWDKCDIDQIEWSDSRPSVDFYDPAFIGFVFSDDSSCHKIIPLAGLIAVRIPQIQPWALSQGARGPAGVRGQNCSMARNSRTGGKATFGSSMKGS
jgi:hypothetical protein